MALCDHNTVAGLSEFLAAAEGTGVEAVPGVEFSTEWEETELHIVGLFIRPCHYDAVAQKLDDFRRRKEESNLALVKNLAAAGYVLDYEGISAGTPGGYINRAHIAAALTERGYTATVKEAFRTLLVPGYGYYQPPRRMSAFEAIAFIKSLGAVAVLAHPLLSLDEGRLRVFLPEAKRCELDAMETVYSTYDEAAARLAEELAREFGLLPSGGSDFHGSNKPDIALGTGRGNLFVPMDFLERLKEI